MIFVKRRVSTWTPASLPSLAGWWDASDTATITASGGATSQWNDKSGNARHFTQGTGSAQPTTGTRTQNALNVLDFDGGDFMSAGDVIDIGSGDLTVACVAKVDVNGNFGLVCKALYGVTVGRWAILRDSGSYQALISDSGGSGTGPTKADSSTAARALLAVIDRGPTNGIVLAFNDVDQGATTQSDTADRDNTSYLLCGAYNNAAGTGAQSGYYLDGFIAEIVICQTALGSTDRASLQSYFATKWGL